MGTETVTPSTEGIWAALAEVVDPELDESLVDVGFVTDVAVDDGTVEIELQLPTFWCSPNFSWLMASDAREAALAVPGVEHAVVTLVGHHYAEEISNGVNRGRTFGEVFETDVDPELRELRKEFHRKALISRQERMLDGLTSAVPDRLGDLPDTDACRRYIQARSRLGIDTSADAAVVVDTDGNPVTVDMERFRRSSRSLRISLDGNSVMCRTMFATRRSRESGRTSPVRLSERPNS